MRGLPAVFDPSRKRWIRPDEAAPDEVVAVVARCPSGALQARRRPSPAPTGEILAEPEQPVITVTTNGPLLLRGRVRIETESGQPIASAGAAALCRCGGTGNPPFCDGTHTRIGFTKP